MSQSMIEVLTIKFFETFVVSNYGIDFFFKVNIAISDCSINLKQISMSMTAILLFTH